MQCSFDTISVADLDDIDAIERLAFKRPWSRQSLLNELNCEGAYTFAAKSNHSGSDSSLVGYIFFRMIFEEMHLMKIAIDEKYRNRGIATGLVEQSITLAISKGASRILLEVRPSNRAAICFYRKLGLTVIGKRKQYYVETGEDALVMYSNLEMELTHKTQTGR